MKNETRRAEYRARKAAGVCATCGTGQLRRKSNGKYAVTCEKCYERQLKVNMLIKRKLRRLAVVNGICSACLTRLAIPTKTRCGVCDEANQDRAQSLREGRRAAGLCVCGSPRDTPRYKQCSACRKAHNTYHQERKARLKRRAA